MIVPKHLLAAVSDALDAFFTAGVLPDRIFDEDDRVSICLLDGHQSKRARLILGPGWVSLALERESGDDWVGDVSRVSESLRDKIYQANVIARMREHVS